MTHKDLTYSNKGNSFNFGLVSLKEDVIFDLDAIKSRLCDVNQKCFIISDNGRIGISEKTVFKSECSGGDYLPVISYDEESSPSKLGDENFKKSYGLHYAYVAGSMANGISSKEMVVSLGKAGMLCSFGAGGLSPSAIEDAIIYIQRELPNGPYAFNLIHNPYEPALERATVDLYLKYGVSVIEASAFLDLTPSVVLYRVAGLKLNSDGHVVPQNKIIAKISRVEVARKFMQPPPEKILNKLLEQGLITEKQVELARKIPMADDITAEADSGGHTDNRPLVTLLPTIIRLRDDIQREYNYDQIIRVGVGGGISTPLSAYAAFSMGAAYVTTGSVNQACVEAGACEHTRKLLAQADMADVAMAPASDMFEMGVKLQVLKRGTLFPMRAQKLYDLYSKHNSIKELPVQEREKLEKQIFRQSLESVWNSTVEFFKQRDPEQIERAINDPKKKMALIFRWYLGLSSRWSNNGEKGREMDYQIWCGPAMGAFNAWVRDSYLEDVNNRRVVDVAIHIMRGAAFYDRICRLKSQGMAFSPSFSEYVPSENLVSKELEGI